MQLWAVNRGLPFCIGSMAVTSKAAPAIFPFMEKGDVAVHNHPSGGLESSRDDERLTCRIKDAGELIGVKLLDHVIISRNGYLSMSDSGMIEKCKKGV